MRILVVSQYYYPENFRINDICEELVKRGHVVTVLTGLPNYPEGIIPQEYRHGKKRREVINGVEVRRCFEVARGKGSVRRVLNYFSFMFSGMLAAHQLNKKSYDVIYGYAPSPIMQMMAALTYKKRSRKPILFYSIDIWPEALKAGMPNKEGVVFQIIKRMSRKIYEDCDRIHVTSKDFVAYIHDTHGIPEGRIAYVPQHAEDLYLQENFTVVDNGCCDFLFAGNVGAAQDMDCIVDAAAFLEDCSLPWKIHIVGDGSYLKEMKLMVQKAELDERFVFHGRHSVAEMPSFYRTADVCLITLKHKNKIGLTLPAKLQGYMAAGKPVIGAIDGAAKTVIEESCCGVCVAASDSVALADAMKAFIEHPEQFAGFGEKGRDYFNEHFTKKIFLDVLEEELHALTNEPTECLEGV